MRFSAIVLVVTASVMGSCDNSPSDVHGPLSGVWQVRIPSFGDSLDVQLGFGFDEVTASAADGGVRAHIRPAPGSFRISQVLKEGHTVSRLEHRNGKTEIAGSVHLGAPFKTLEFSGTIDDDNNFSFRYKSPAGSGTAVAKYAGEYVRPASPTLLRAGRASMADASGTIGQYSLGGTMDEGRFCSPGCQVTGPVTLSGTLFIQDANPDGYGGYVLNVSYVTPYPGLSPALPSSGDLFGGYFSVDLGAGTASRFNLSGEASFDASVSQTFGAILVQTFPTGQAQWMDELTRSPRQ